METVKVKCLVENCGQEFGSLSMHLKKHGLTTQQYRKLYKTDNIGYSITQTEDYQKKMAARETEKKTVKANYSPTDQMLAGFSIPELNMYEENYKVLWEQTGEDASFQHTIKNIVFNDIMILRYQDELQKKKDLNDRKVLTEIINKLQASNISSLDKLNVTKEKKDQLNKTPETSPSRLVTAVAFVRSLMPPEQRARQAKDEAEALERLRNNERKLLDAMPVEVEVTDLDIKSLE